MKFDSKSKAMVVALVVLACIFSLLIWAYVSFMNGGSSMGVLPVSIIVLVTIFMIPYVKRRFTDIRGGYPTEDELSKKVLTKATSRHLLSHFIG